MTPTRLLLAALLLAVACLGGAKAPRAHPHVWIEASATLEVTAGAATALRVTWRFDELYSAAVTVDFDADGDGRLDRSELAALAELSRDNLADYSFFTHLRIEGERRRVERVEDFVAAVEAERVIYRFTVPFDPPLALRDDAFAFSLFDETYYVDLALAEDAVSVHAADGGTALCREERRVDERQPLYFGLFFPTYVGVSCEG